MLTLSLDLGRGILHKYELHHCTYSIVLAAPAEVGPHVLGNAYGWKKDRLPLDILSPEIVWQVFTSTTRASGRLCYE